MALGLLLIAIALISLIYGIINRKKKFVVTAIVLFVFIVVVWVVYSYLYSLTPY